jgi:hypothetical protein
MEKKTKNLGRNNGKIGRPPADWLFDLKDKVYTTEELVKITKKSKPNVQLLMRKYCLEINYEVQKNAKVIAYYKWNKNFFLQKLNAVVNRYY